MSAMMVKSQIAAERLQHGVITLLQFQVGRRDTGVHWSKTDISLSQNFPY